MDADLAAEHRRLVLEHGRQALAAAAVAVAFVALTAVPPLSAARTAGFALAAALLLVAHLAIVLVDRRASSDHPPWSGWPLAALHGGGWTVIILLVWPADRDDQLLFLSFVVAWCAAAALASAPFVLHAALVMGPPVVATAVEFVVAGGRENAAIAVGLLLYAAATIALHARASDSLMRAIRLQIEHDVRSRRLGELALTDPLTGVGNRRALVSRLESELTRLTPQRPASLALLDLDRFKLVNDRLGHGAGDTVLTTFAAIVRTGLSPSEIVARTGGEEFAILLPGVDRTRAVQRLDQLRGTVARELLVAGEPVTVSIGVHELQAEDTVLQALESADVALYEAKRAGRNRVASSALGS